MGEYTEILKDYLKENRKSSKKFYKVGGTIYRAIMNNRTTFDEAIKQLCLLGGTSNE